MARKHVLVMVMPAFGHYIPGLELSKKLALYHDVTLCISNLKVPEIIERGLLPPAPIRLLGVDDKLTFNVDERVHEFKECIRSLVEMFPHYETLINSFSTPQQPSDNAHGIPPVSGIFVDWTIPQPIKYAHARGIPAYAFSPGSPTRLARVGANTPAPADALMDGSKSELIKNVVPDFMKERDMETGQILTLAKEMLFNSFPELEPRAVESLARLTRYAAIPKKFIGPLLPYDEPLDQKKKPLEQHILDWLNTQEAKSVVYFSFGTVAVPKPKQIVEVAAALTSLKRPFIWALRPFLQKHLPEQYRVSTVDSWNSNAPYLILPWAPQKHVLAHPSTGVFVSHCGWNSALEAVSYGVPIVGWPMFGDQHGNALMLQQLGVALLLPGIGVIGREEIVEALLTVAGWKEGGASGYRQTMEDLGATARAAIAPDGQSTKNLLSVINHI